MPTLPFGQPANGIIQMAYVVADVHASIDHWMKDLNVGPWYLLENFTPEAVYRGETCVAPANAAFAFAGHMNIELIQPLTDAPGIHRETMLKRGPGFHHHGLASADVDADEARFLARGYRNVYEAVVPTGGKVIYLEGPGDQPGFVELIAMTPAAESLFTKMWRSAQDWDGDPRPRSFLDLLD